MHNHEKGLNWNSASYFKHSEVYDLFAQKEDAPDLVWRELRKRLTGHILDAGCGTGKYLQKCKDSGLNAQGVDRSDSQIEIALNKGLPAKVCDLLNIKELNLKFDSIFSCWVLGTIPVPDRDSVLTQMKACLNKKGVIYLVENEPFCDFELIRGHNSIINNSTIYEDWLRKKGFKKELTLNSQFGFDTDEQAFQVFNQIWGNRIKEKVPRSLKHDISLWKFE